MIYNFKDEKVSTKTGLELKVEELEAKVEVLEKEVDELMHQMKYIATLR